MNDSIPASALFAHIPERNTTDNLLRTAQQHHYQMSSMADTKANIVITVSSIVLTLCFNRMGDQGLQLSMITLVVFTLLALLLAILAVLPKYQPPKLDGTALPRDFNVLFFGHFTELSRERFLEEVARTLTPNGSPYATAAGDLYSIGCYLARYKYRYLRWSYLSFLVGFVLASIQQLFRLLSF